LKGTPGTGFGGGGTFDTSASTKVPDFSQLWLSLTSMIPLDSLESWDFSTSG
jgi:hypothetical protein